MSKTTPLASAGLLRPNSKRYWVIIGVSGASGALMAGRAIELVSTPSARMVWKQETGTGWADTVKRWQETGLITEHNPTQPGRHDRQRLVSGAGHVA